MPSEDDLLAREASNLALATLYRAALHLESPESFPLPKKETSLEHRFVEVLEGAPELRRNLEKKLTPVAKAPRGKANAELRKLLGGRAAAPGQLAKAGYRDLVGELDLFGHESVLGSTIEVQPFVPGGGQGEAVGQTSQALAEGQSYVKLTVHAVQCIDESDSEGGADDLYGYIGLLTKDGKTALSRRIYFGDFDDGTHIEYRATANVADVDTWPKSYSIPIDKLSMGDPVIGTITIYDDDSITDFWNELAGILHQAGLIAVYAYVYYQTGDHSKAGAAMDLADKVGSFIGSAIQGQTSADWLGTATIPWSAYPGSSGRQSVDILSERHQSHYRIFFEITHHGTLHVEIVMPPQSDDPLQLVPVGKQTHVELGVSADGSDIVWVVDADGRVSRVAGEQRIEVARGITQVSLGSASHIWAVDGNHKVYSWSGSAFVEVPGTLRQVSVGADGVAWGITPSGELVWWRRSNISVGRFGRPHISPAMKDRWQVAGKLEQVDVGSVSRVCGLSEQGVTYSMDAKEHRLVQRSTSPALSQVAVSSDGATWGIDDVGNLYVANDAGAWRAVKANVRLKRIGVTSARVFYGLDFNGRLWRFQGPDTRVR